MTSVAVQTKASSFTKEMIITILASLLFVLFSQAKIYLPFSCVPIVFQNSIAIFLGASLGSKKGAIATALFLLYGVLNAPVFASGALRVQALIGPTGGYLLGYLLSAYLVGKAKELNLIKNNLILTLFGHLVILSLGTIWLSNYISLGKSFLIGFLPFIATDVLKSVLVARLIRKNI